MDIITNIIRTFLWGLAYAIFLIGDAVYEVTVKVGTMNMGELKIVWDYWAVLSIMIGGIATIRILILGVRYFLDEELQEKLDVFKILSRVVFVSLAIGLMPMGIKYITTAGTTFVENIGLVTGNGSDTIPSTLIISSVIGDAFQVEDESGGYEIPKTYKLEDIEINHKESGSSDYAYFNEMGDIFILIIMGGIAIVGLILIAIEVAERYFKLGIKILISPIPISGIVNPDDQGFQKWYRLVIADVVLNCIQLLSLLFILAVASSSAVRSQGVWVTLVMFIGGLFAVLKGVPELAPIIGGDSSTQGALQQLASIRQATSGMGSALGGALGGAAGAVGGSLKTAGAGATYAAGRMMGGKSMADISSDSQSSSDSEFKSGGQESRNDNRENVQTSSGSNFNESSQSQSDFSNQTLNTQGVNADVHGDSLNQSQDLGADIHADNNRQTKQNEFQGASEPKRQNEPPLNDTGRSDNGSLARSGTFASDYVNKAYGEKGGRFAKIASTAGRHVYQGSVNRLNQSLPARASAMYRQAMQGTQNGKGEDAR